MLGIDHSPHGEPDRAGSGANKASEDDPNLLYDGVADTLVSLLLRNAQHLREEFPISDDPLFRPRFGRDRYQGAMDLRPGRREMWFSGRREEIEARNELNGNLAVKKKALASFGGSPSDVQKAGLPMEQKRIADELDQRVAERTGQLAAANEELRNEVAERKRAEQALAASERDLSLIVNTVPGLAWSIRSDGHIEFLNQNFLDYLGLALDEVQKSGWTFPIHPEDTESFARVRQAILASDAVGEVEARIRRFDGEFRCFLCRAVALRDPSGKVVKWFGINFDIEDRKRAEAELRDTQSKLAHMTRLMTIGQLTASIAHEVNQPLAGIITNANTCLRMLAAQPPNIEGARETARRTIRDGNRASEVIKRLRALFSKKDPALEPVDLNEATREVIALSLSKLQANRVILRTELADGLPNVSGDRVQLQQVILNLIQNGSDAMSSIDDRPREMLVKTERDGHEALCLTVRDVGVGVSEEDGARLFDAFYTTKGEGMGIGLSVSRSIIERHGGRMWTAGNAGPGVTFSFSVPLLPEQKTDADTTARAGTPRSMQRQLK